MADRAVAAVARVVAGVPANPRGMACPLCRRKNTVHLIEEDTHRCNYSGCFGYTWDELRPLFR